MLLLREDSIKELSYVLGHSYSNARFIGTNVNVSREVGLLTKEYGEISQFHQGLVRIRCLMYSDYCKIYPPNHY